MPAEIVGPVAPPHVDAIWPHVADGFHRAVMRTGGDLTIGELWQGCRRGDLFLLIAHEDGAVIGASIWKPELWQTGRKLRCMGVYGTKFKLWQDAMREAATRIAKACGATSFVAEGRDGWSKIFPKAKRLRVLYEESI